MRIPLTRIAEDRNIAFFSNTTCLVFLPPLRYTLPDEPALLTTRVFSA